MPAMCPIDVDLVVFDVMNTSVPLFDDRDVETAENLINAALAAIPVSSASVQTPTPSQERQTSKRCIEEDEINEFLVYINTSFGDDVDLPVLEFWKKSQFRFPKLFQIARRIFCVPASSAAVERLFSDLRFVVDGL